MMYFIVSFFALLLLLLSLHFGFPFPPFCAVCAPCSHTARSKRICQHNDDDARGSFLE